MKGNGCLAWKQAFWVAVRVDNCQLHYITLLKHWYWYSIKPNIKRSNKGKIYSFQVWVYEISKRKREISFLLIFNARNFHFPHPVRWLVLTRILLELAFWKPLSNKSLLSPSFQIMQIKEHLFKSERNGNVKELVRPYFIFNFHRQTANCLEILNNNEI